MKTYSKMLKLREQLDIPVQFMLNVDLEDKDSGFFYKTRLTNYGGGGIVIEWELCEFCEGYTPGGVHPKCIFSMFDADREDSSELTLYIHLSDKDEMIKLKGKVIYTFKQKKKEQIGIEFSGNAEEAFKLLNAAFEK